MDKPYYETEEYSEAENELDSYDDPIKLVMEYRISEKHKDSQIAELKEQLAESEKERHEEWKTGKEWKWEWQKVNQKLEKADQDKISFAVDILEELAGCSNYINSKLDFECGSYVSEKAIRDKIKYLKGKKDE